MHLWIRAEWILFNKPPALFWCICTLYYAFWMWLALFLSKEYRQYPGMSMDALFGGLLLAVASALHDADVLSDLSKKGFGWAAWVVLFSACGLVFRNFASMSRNAKRAVSSGTALLCVAPSGSMGAVSEKRHATHGHG
jgi:hypothetical protein